MSNLTIYTSPEALATAQKIKQGEALPIVAPRRGNVSGSKYNAILLPANNMPNTDDVPACYKSIIEKALKNAVKSILSNYIKNPSTTKEWIPEGLVSADAILKQAGRTSAGTWMLKEALEKGWLACSARKELMNRLAQRPDNQKKAYLAMINKFAEPILKMSGKKNDMLSIEEATKQLEQFISFTAESDIENEFEQFIIMRYEMIINKEEEEDDNVDINGL
jgi:phosphopantetheinyl transferase (holo-ACP synthase)